MLLNIVKKSMKGPVKTIKIANLLSYYYQKSCF